MFLFPVKMKVGMTEGGGVTYGEGGLLTESVGRLLGSEETISFTLLTVTASFCLRSWYEV